MNNYEEYCKRLIDDLFEYLEKITKGTDPIAADGKAIESVPGVAEAIIKLLSY
ncbi:MAG: hypothetical protein PUA82_03730 [Eubacteriales bacterium]|nr:hypothetical protein [Eubacteriales bacterium]